MNITSKTVGYSLLLVSLLFTITYFLQSWFGEVSSPNGAWLLGFLFMIGGGYIVLRDELHNEE